MLFSIHQAITAVMDIGGICACICDSLISMNHDWRHVAFSSGANHHGGSSIPLETLKFRFDNYGDAEQP